MLSVSRRLWRRGEIADDHVPCHLAVVITAGGVEQGQNLLRAVVLGDTPWSLRVADGWPEPELGSGQVMVRVQGVGICGSDLGLISGARRVPAHPWVLGHEAFGEVVAAGDGVAASRVGQRVVIEPNYPCLDCPACRTGRTSMCPNRVLVGFTAPGLLAEYAGARAAGPGDAGFETIFETSGAEAALGEAVSRAAHGATVVLIGLGGQAARVDTGLVVRRQIVLRGSLIYDHPRDFAATLTAAIPSPGRILRASYPLREAPEAFRASRAVPGKTWIRVTA
jgi:threonine dehydrogenase-like Zn-dependent dehydrogenase